MKTGLGALLVTLVFTSILEAAAPDPKHTSWDKWLKKFTTVTGPVTTVNYKKAKAEPALLSEYLKQIEATTKEDYSKMGDNEKLAFLINAYNALTVQWIVQNYPVKSIKDTGGFLSSPWKKKFFKLFGEEQHLDGIEHGMIRKEFQEPRIHFAVVCASIGCPALKGEAYTGLKLEEQLETSAKNFLSDSTRNRYSESENRYYLSKIFDWYGSDFETKKTGSVKSFVSARMGLSKEAAEKAKEAKVSFLDYDWKLNESPENATH